MVEYAIEVIHGKGSPYLVGTYRSSRDAKIALDNMLKLYRVRRKIFFVDNDFYNNEFPNSIGGDYYCIKQRNVSEWTVYSECRMDTNYKNNIINFNKMY